MEKMLKGQFIDFKEDLIDNVALMTQLQELGAGVASAAGSRSRLRDVSDPFTWVYCYLSFVVVLCPDSRTHELLAYGQIIIQLARSHGREGWLTYDCRWPQGHHLAGPKSTHHYCPGFDPSPEWSQLPVVLVLGPWEGGLCSRQPLSSVHRWQEGSSPTETLLITWGVLMPFQRWLLPEYH